MEDREKKLFDRIIQASEFIENTKNKFYDELVFIGDCLFISKKDAIKFTEKYLNLYNKVKGKSLEFDEIDFNNFKIEPNDFVSFKDYIKINNKLSLNDKCIRYIKTEGDGNYNLYDNDTNFMLAPFITVTETNNLESFMADKIKVNNRYKLVDVPYFNICVWNNKKSCTLNYMNEDEQKILENEIKN